MPVNFDREDCYGIMLAGSTVSIDSPPTEMIPVVLRNPYIWQFDFQKCVRVNHVEFRQLQPTMSISPCGVRIIWHACPAHTGSPLSN